MNRDLRWRILSLQIVAVIVLAVLAGVGYWGYGFTHDQVQTQLKQQKIVFPPANSVEITALPAKDAAAMKQYAGQTMTTGDQAKVWANDFIAVHLNTIGSGKTYNYWSGKAQAEQASNPKQYAVDNNVALLLFRGETLRSLLLNAWAFWFLGDLALYGAIALTAGSAIVLLAFLFELLIAPRAQEATKRTRQTGPQAAIPVS
ncbi:MAG TPA: hypothetical protein VF898_07875 [Chloroflexota bacterium]